MIILRLCLPKASTAFWNGCARDLGRLLSAMPDFDASQFDAEQLQQAIAVYTPPCGALLPRRRDAIFTSPEWNRECSQRFL
jgi:hypothetical protein